MKYKAAVVGHCSTCCSMSFLYLEAAYLHRSWPESHSATPSHQLSQVSASRQGGAQAPLALQQPSAPPQPCTSPAAHCNLPDLRCPASYLQHWCPANSSVQQQDTSLQASDSDRTYCFSFFWVTQCGACTLHGICRINHATKSREPLKHAIWCTALTCAATLFCLCSPAIFLSWCPQLQSSSCKKHSQPLALGSWTMALRRSSKPSKCI